MLSLPRLGVVVHVLTIETQKGPDTRLASLTQARSLHHHRSVVGSDYVSSQDAPYELVVDRREQLRAAHRRRAQHGSRKVYAFRRVLLLQRVDGGELHATAPGRVTASGRRGEQRGGGGEDQETPPFHWEPVDHHTGRLPYPVQAVLGRWISIGSGR